MPPLGGGLYYRTILIYLVRVGGEGFVCYQVFLFRTRYVRYSMSFSCIFFMRVFMLFFGIFSLVGWSMECSWIAPLTPAVMVIRELTFHPFFV